ncbi:MAG TPA: CHAT domain-containing tetratricopeptide repeat protein [Gammaproteobacteria bacterium]|nr:CHAT domain-containing tetratricopeptide repeat protein [Gammaproteobacteria bacterium]
MKRWLAPAAMCLLALAARGDPPAPEPDASPKKTDPRFAVADTLREEGQFQQAMSIYRALRDEFAAAGDTAQQWRAQLWYADMLRRAGDAEASAAGLAEALSLAGNDPRRVAATRLGQCNLLSWLGRSDEAIDECAAGLEMAESIGDRHLEARAHFMLGTVHSRRGRFRLSVAETEQALALRRRHGGSPYEMAGTLNSMGIEYAAVGRLGEAESMYQEGLTVAGSFSSPWYAFHLHSNLAHLRAGTGDMEGALESIRESLRGAGQLADQQGMVYAHNSFAEFYLQAGNRAAARRHLEQSLAIGENVAAIHRVIALVMLGEIEAADSLNERAVATLAEALTLAEASDFGLQGVNIRGALTGLAAARGDAAAARRWAEEAVTLAETLGSPDALIEALEARAVAIEASGGSGGPEAYLEAIELLESWRGRLALGDLRMGVAEPRWAVYEGAVRTLLSRGRADDAFEVAERARARLLLELLAERDASRAGGSRPERIRQQLRARFQERLAAAEPAERAALDLEIRQLTASLAGIEAQARRADPAAGSAQFPQPAALADVQAGLLGAGRALLTVFWGDRDVYAWWITGKEVRAARLGSSDSLAALVDFLGNVVQRPSGQLSWTAPARRAFDTLIAPLDPEPAETVYVVAGGPLAHVPLELLIPDEAAAPWGATTRIVYGPSASVLLSLAQSSRPDKWQRSLLAVGNPSPDLGAIRPASDWRDDPLAPLPNAAGEARDIHRMFRSEGADLLLGGEATLSGWLNLDPARYRYLHFAAHARVSDRRPEQTHLVLAAGRLDLAAIRELRLDAELVTLSACETALGRRVRGEGIIGLPHAFLAAGARGAVVTLWRIDDEAAAGFMRDFYRQLRAGCTAADALLAVRRQRLAAGDDAARWAAFVLVGGI